MHACRRGGPPLRTRARLLSATMAPFDLHAAPSRQMAAQLCSRWCRQRGKHGTHLRLASLSVPLNLAAFIRMAICGGSSTRARLPLARTHARTHLRADVLLLPRVGQRARVDLARPAQPAAVDTHRALAAVRGRAGARWAAGAGPAGHGRAVAIPLLGAEHLGANLRNAAG